MKAYNNFVEYCKEGLDQFPNKKLFFEVTDELADKIAEEIDFKGSMEEFKMGLEVEQEHMLEPFAVLKTDDSAGAGKIAAIHLSEDKKYYTKLKSLNL